MVSFLVEIYQWMNQNLVYVPLKQLWVNDIKFFPLLSPFWLKPCIFKKNVLNTYYYNLLTIFCWLDFYIHFLYYSKLLYENENIRISVVLRLLLVGESLALLKLFNDYIITFGSIISILAISHSHISWDFFTWFNKNGLMFPSLNVLYIFCII